MQNDILFDNIYIGHSVEDAKKLQAETFDIKHPIEESEEEASKPKPDTQPSSPLDLVFKDDPVKYVREKLDLFLTIAKRDPVEAIKFMPEVAGGIGAVVVTVLAIIIGLVSVGSSSPQVQKAAEKTKGAAADAKDKVTEAVASGAETAKAEASKRTTRSSAPAEK
jgi:calnexin